MTPLHTFASKKEAALSLAWLDENFQQALDVATEARAGAEAVAIAQAAVIAALQAKLLELEDRISKLGNTPGIVERVIAKLKEKI